MGRRATDVLVPASRLLTRLLRASQTEGATWVPKSELGRGPDRIRLLGGRAAAEELPRREN
jgi:hypothetical protein